MMGRVRRERRRRWDDLRNFFFFLFTLLLFVSDFNILFVKILLSWAFKRV